MKNKINTKEQGKRLTWIGGGIVLLTIIVTAIMSWLLYQNTVNLLTDNLRQRLMSIGITLAANIDAKDVEALQLESDWKKPEWARVVKSLKRTKDANSNIVFVYIFRKTKSDPTKMEFVADAESINPYANTDDDPGNDVDANKDGKIESDGPDQLQWPGQEYPTPPAEVFQAYDGPLTNKDLYSDSYGQVLTGYAPIKDSNGKTVAVLGTDIKANDFSAVTAQTLYPFLLFINFLVLLIIFLAVVLIKLWNKRVQIFAELDRQKDDLLGFVVHQLRNPVGVIQWQIEDLLDEKEEKSTKIQKETLAQMQKISVNLHELIEMLLDVSRVQLGKLTITSAPLDLKEFFEDLLGTISIKVKEKKINFSTDIDTKLPVALLDRKYTHMTMENLLTNALKYTPSNGKVDFTVKIKNKTLYCTVQDTGCGIPKQDQDKIFGKLYRASNVRNSSEIDGNGFGLYVAKGAIEMQGGKIWFESEEGKGTTFFVELPLIFSESV